MHVFPMWDSLNNPICQQLDEPPKLNFQQQECGAAYEGYFAHLKMAVAIKKIKCISKQEKKELITQVKNINQLRHPNLVRLLGWCHEKDEFLLVYEFVPNSSLDSHLFGNKGPLTWDMRYRIAKGLASALLYLHEEWEKCVLHKHVQSSNAMLDSDFNVKLGGFGLAEITASVRDLGYLASEYARTCRGSKASDVHSFGLVALEIATGKRAADLNLVEWVGEHYRNGTLILAADNKLGVGFDKKEMKCLLIVGIWCGQKDEDVRPSSMWEVIHVLNFHALLPNLSINSMRSSSLTSTSYHESQMSCSSIQ